MASVVDHIFCYLLILLVNLHHFETIQAYKNVSLGSTLYANDNNLTWTSPSGDFAFGFRHLEGGSEDKFLLAIWFDKVPEKTIVWSANGDYPTYRESKVELTTEGELVLEAPSGWKLWNTDKVNNGQPIYGAMLDTGNFVIASRNSNSQYLWESFKHPTDTILPTQLLGRGDQLTSSTSENNYATGKFQLRLLADGKLVLNQIDDVTRYAYAAYYTIAANISQLVFNESFPNITLQNSETNRDLYHRATLNFDGTFTLYSHPKTYKGNERWSIIQAIPDNICTIMVTFMGGGPCGFNSLCELSPEGKPICSCPTSYTFLDPNNRYGGCKPEYAYYAPECNQKGTTVDEDRFSFTEMTGADWPLADYERLTPSTEYECRDSCLRDCYCAVAIFQDQIYSATRQGSCWKKRLPLSNGRLNHTTVDRKALFKIFKATPSSQNPRQQNSGKENKNSAILILSILLGTSVFFNFFSISAVSLVIFCLWHKKLSFLNQTPTVRDLDTNLSSFTYEQLEESTNGFKEELGRGAFGTVYKGVLASRSSNCIAVKKLDKMVQDGEKEFKTEVNVIGQTHHKNLVRLLGYCNEGENRLLVYEFMHAGSLSNFLFGIIRPSWQQRIQIAIGIARGLMYLHEECSTQIIHCDIKPQNILLDDSFTPKISDFGLAKLLINNRTRTLTGIRGTKGYVAPEWFRNTPVTVKVDVYSFGIVLLEIISCRKCVELEMEKEAILAEWAYECYRKRRLEKLAENDEEARSNMKMLEKMVMVAIWCVQEEPLLRPSMRAVTLMLEGILEVSPPPCPFLLSSSAPQHHT